MKCLITEEQQQQFIIWAALWHGDHDLEQYDGICEPCPVYQALKAYKNNTATFQQVYDAVTETEGADWFESWEHFISETILK